jgi:hypothetical protein
VERGQKALGLGLAAVIRALGQQLDHGLVLWHRVLPRAHSTAKRSPTPRVHLVWVRLVQTPLNLLERSRLGHVMER